MKRFRFTRFFIDTGRNIVKHYQNAKLPSEAIQQILKKEFEPEFVSKYGAKDTNNKIQRYLSFKPPDLCVVMEYHPILYEIADAYIAGYYYPALTGACCLGEHIFNILILNLRKYFRNSSFYKKVYSKEYIQDWDLAIEVLLDWNILNADVSDEYKKLRDIRHESIHLKNIPDSSDKALEAIRYIMSLTDYLFGLKSDVFFIVDGELYIKKALEKEAIVKEYYIPSCALVGYKHSIDSDWRIKDGFQYEDKEIDDDKFGSLRKAFRKNCGDKSA